MDGLQSSPAGKDRARRAGIRAVGRDTEWADDGAPIEGFAARISRRWSNEMTIPVRSPPYEGQLLAGR
jgi:hypothetical protein